MCLNRYCGEETFVTTYRKNNDTILRVKTEANVQSSITIYCLEHECPDDEYIPVCGENGMSFKSPCSAGCSYDDLKQEKYFNCTCAGTNQFAIHGRCLTHCDGAIYTMVLLALRCFLIGAILSAMASVKVRFPFFRFYHNQQHLHHCDYHLHFSSQLHLQNRQNGSNVDHDSVLQPLRILTFSVSLRISCGQYLYPMESSTLWRKRTKKFFPPQTDLTGESAISKSEMRFQSSGDRTDIRSLYESPSSEFVGTTNETIQEHAAVPYYLPLCEKVPIAIAMTSDRTSNDVSSDDRSFNNKVIKKKKTSSSALDSRQFQRSGRESKTRGKKRLSSRFHLHISLRSLNKADVPLCQNASLF
ncbi:solute carrier organic anion transporter family member 2B1 isoform X2 [Octopus vulgaris]|uniref:Solute carrier organic anion transporter family member 2B1 isoform X2 n=1 Tax=Octopus vulgaris TaxID=6645 RepID=A0AA36F159_OCTVU|nr:solute carrier organic anion transporter family member 2B1 isoform X2 [Octopus vulgaris]